CLLGEEVRYDGGHKRDDWILNVLGTHVTWVPVCPEFEVGMGVPREALRLIGHPDAPRMVTEETRIDFTDRMMSYARRRVRQLEAMGLSGYILKSRSPSCGMERVRVYTGRGAPVRRGRGLFARVLMNGFDYMPVEEEGRMADPALRANFVEQVFCYSRWREFKEGRSSILALSDFHERHRFLLMAHSRRHLRQLEGLVTRANGRRPGEVLDEYGRGFFEALRVLPTARKHVISLQRISGLFGERLEREDRQELMESIEGYRRGLLPRLIPLALLRHHARKSRVPCVQDQVYLFPDPGELMLRNDG
ncbi:MAG: hypothetical protein A3K11_00355, partial [Nitrospirae bacterium RIFCSPLOWO2_12_FULL_63_8]